MVFQYIYDSYAAIITASMKHSLKIKKPNRELSYVLKLIATRIYKI
jgi:hypothetical protein